MAETIPGGRYIINGQWVDANGRPLPAPAHTEPRTHGDEAQAQDEAEVITPEPPAVPRRPRGRR